MKTKQIILSIIGVFLLSLFFFFIFQISFPKATSRLETEVATTAQSQQKETIRFTALGDSLTEGIGDESGQGGFVPMVANSLQEEFKLRTVEIENFGVTGNRSEQILKRLKEQEDLRNNIGTSDIITLTVGGNDLMRVVQRNIFGLSIQTFEKPLAKYQEQLTELLEEIRTLNPEAPIYVVGIYNPFYVNFPEITDMQTIVNNWNTGTEEVISEEANTYFIPVDQVITAGLVNEVEDEDIQEGTGNDLNVVKNTALYEKDHFHPNHLGYQLMARVIKDEISRTQTEWLLEN